jgi:hypothetical protein
MASIDLQTIITILAVCALLFFAYNYFKNRGRSSLGSGQGFPPQTRGWGENPAKPDQKAILIQLRKGMRLQHDQLTNLFKDFDKFLDNLQKKRAYEELQRPR